MSINALKKEFNKGYLRKTKFLLELYVPDEDSRSLQVLCQKVSTPQRSIQAVKLFHKGRPFFIRGETEFGGSVELSFLENSFGDVRRIFENWLTQVDNPELAGKVKKKKKTSLKQSLKNEAKELKNVAKNVKGQVNNLKNIKSIGDGKNQLSTLLDFGGSMGSNSGVPEYQTNVRIWQLNHKNDFVYGYELQGQFITGISSSTFDATGKSEQQTIDVTLAFSEVLPVDSPTEGLLSRVIGADMQKTITNVKRDFKI